MFFVDAFRYYKTPQNGGLEKCKKSDTIVLQNVSKNSKIACKPAISQFDEIFD